MLQAAVEGQGIALARTSLLANDVRNGLLVRLFDIDVPAPRSQYLVYPPRLAESPKLVLFRAWLRSEVGKDATQPDATSRRTSAAARVPTKRRAAKRKRNDRS